MPRMILHTGEPFDDGGHARQGPQIGAKSMRSRPLAERAVDPLELPLVQFWLAARSTHSTQGGQPAPLPLSVPAADTLAAHLQGPSDRCQNLAHSEQLGGLLAPIFQGSEIPSRTHLYLHASIMHEVLGLVTVFCETH